MDKTILKTNYGFITVTHMGPGIGTVDSDIRVQVDLGDNPHQEFDAAIDAVESMVLAHACADIALVRNPNYIVGVNATLDAIINNLG